MYRLINELGLAHVIFVVGEHLRDTFILARGHVECVVINAAQFSIQGKSEHLRRMKTLRDASLPDNKVLYAQFQANRKWHEFRHKLVNDIITRKEVPRMTSIKDVPRSILNIPTIPSDLIHYRALPKAI